MVTASAHHSRLLQGEVSREKSKLASSAMQEEVLTASMGCADQPAGQHLVLTGTKTRMHAVSTALVP